MWVSRVRRAEYKRVLTNLAAEGIDVLVLKGVALGSLVYPDVGTRPSSDLDVFVGPDGYDATMNYLQTNHPQNYGDESRGIPKVRHSRGAVIDGYAVDIHWRLLWDRYDDQPDRELHARSIELPLGDTALRTIGLEDHLLHAIVHGLRPNHLSSVRWVVDSALLIGTGLIRWDLFRQIVCDRRVGGVVARGLGLLRENFDVEVPAGLIEQLSHADTRMWNWADNLPRVNHRLRVQNYLSQYVAAYILGSWNWSVRDKAIRYREFITSILEGGEAHRLEQSGFLPKPVLSLPAGSEWLG